MKKNVRRVGNSDVYIHKVICLHGYLDSYIKLHLYCQYKTTHDKGMFNDVMSHINSTSLCHFEHTIKSLNGLMFYISDMYI